MFGCTAADQWPRRPQCPRRKQRQWSNQRRQHGQSRLGLSVFCHPSLSPTCTQAFSDGVASGTRLASRLTGRRCNGQLAIAIEVSDLAMFLPTDCTSVLPAKRFILGLRRRFDEGMDGSTRSTAHCPLPTAQVQSVPQRRLGLGAAGRHVFGGALQLAGSIAVAA